MKSKQINIPERLIQKSILQFLAANRIFVFRVNTMGVYDPMFKGYRRHSAFSIRGVADILGIMPGGRFLAVEVKAAKGRQSPDQKHFEELVKRAGGIYVLARSIDDVRFLVDEARSA